LSPEALLNHIKISSSNILYLKMCTFEQLNI